jgi:mono/diheme cytochrome c family protein
MSVNPLGRLHALWTLDGLGALDRDTLVKALTDADPRVLAGAVRLAEPLLKAGDEAVTARVVALASSLQPSIRLQVALSLGESSAPEALAALWTYARDTGNQPYLLDAVVNSFSGREDQLVTAALAEAANPGPTSAAAVTLATTAALRAEDVKRSESVLAAALASASPAWLKTAALEGVEALSPPAGGRGGRGPRGFGSGPRGPGAGRGGPGGRGGQAPGVMLPAEPTAIVTLAASVNDPLAARASAVLERLRWPGKPGMIEETVLALTAEQQRLFDLGREHYNMLCAACHLPTGQGQPGVAATLVGSRWVAGDDRVLARLVLEGKARDNLIMPPMRTIFDDQTLAGVLTYIRRSWGNNEAPVSPEVVGQARAASADSQQPLTETDLERLLQELPPRSASR